MMFSWIVATSTCAAGFFKSWLKVMLLRRYMLRSANIHQYFESKLKNTLRLHKQVIDTCQVIVASHLNCLCNRNQIQTLFSPSFSIEIIS